MLKLLFSREIFEKSFHSFGVNAPARKVARVKMPSFAILILVAGLIAGIAQDAPVPTISFTTNLGTSLRLSLTNAGTGKYSIQRSTNLSSWTSVNTLVLTNTTAGSLTVTNDRPAAFFRVAALPSVTQGRATTVVTSLLVCAGSRLSGVGTIVATDGTVWKVPAATAFTNGLKASDLYNDCSGFRPTNLSAVNLSSVPITEVDADGQIITGYLFGDNYFELYVNGKLVGVDPVPFTPFNSCVVRFKAKSPITYAVRLVDWEENLGLGSETNNGSSFHAGDGGFIASFSDGTVTDSRWKAQTFYIAPLATTNCVVELPDGTRQSSTCTTSPTCNGTCFAMHYPLPPNWFAKTFNDASWPAATTYTEATVGVNNKPAYMNFLPQFSGAGAQFIWSSNLILDNEVIVRFTTP